MRCSLLLIGGTIGPVSTSGKRLSNSTITLIFRLLSESLESGVHSAPSRISQLLGDEPRASHLAFRQIRCFARDINSIALTPFTSFPFLQIPTNYQFKVLSIRFARELKKAWISHSGGAPPSNGAGWPHATRRPLLVCMDFRQGYSLGASSHRRYQYRLENLHGCRAEL